MLEGDYIKKISSKEKAHIKSKCLKIEKERNKYNKGLARVNRNNETVNADGDVKTKINGFQNAYIAVPPSVFSFEKNNEETTEFFNKVIYQMHRKIRNRKFYFNLQDVEDITVDAIMYLLSIIYNLKGISYLNYTYYGNNSNNSDVNSLLSQSGFYRYVNYTGSNFQPVKNIEILKGKKCDPVSADLVCEFLEKNLKNKKTSDSLYQLLIELMGNTVQHAYKKSNSVFKRSWYIYAEETSNAYKFVFLDTGVGIPKTVKRKNLEHLRFLTSDSKLIESALRGEDRSETGDPNRGSGLPFVKQYGQNDNISDFMILSGCGQCQIAYEELGSRNSDQKNELNGTLYRWQVLKNVKENINENKSIN